MPTEHEEGFRNELYTELNDITPQLDGLHKQEFIPQDFQETLTKIKERITIIVDRITYIRVTLKAMEKLDAHGFPSIPVFEVDPKIEQDLQNDIDQMIIAKQGFKSSPPATSLGGTFGDPEPKSAGIE